MSIDRRAAIVTCLVACSALVLAAPAGAGEMDAGTAWRFTFESVDGGAMPLSAHAGKVLLIVNTASKCGYTYQYKGLQTLWERHGAEGLVVIGVPSNDFNQEPGTNADIKGFCGGTFGVTFPLAAKSTVRGAGAHPFYRWASQSLGPAQEPRWNFHKYLVGRDGRLIAAFPSHVDPEDPRLGAAIRTALARSVS